MTPLEIQIQTTADLNGLKLTEASLQRVKEATQQAASKGDAYVQAHSKVTDEMKQQAQAALKNIDATKKLADESGSLAKNVNSARGAFSGLKDVIGGALTGNILQVGQGLGKISAAATNASPAMQALFSQIARGAAAASVVAGPLIVAIGAMKLMASENEAAMKSMWDEAAKKAEAYKVASAAVTAAAEADLARLSAAVAKLAGEYSDLLARMDKAASRQKELNSANKALELSTATTDEQRAAIEARYAAADIGGDISQAGVRKTNAEQAQNQANQNIRDAEAAVRDAQANFDANPTRANQDAVNLAKANAGKVTDEAGKVISQTQAEIESANQTIKIGGIKEQTLANNNARASAPAASSSSSGSSSSGSSGGGSSMAYSGDYNAQSAAIKLASFNGSISPQAAASALQKLNTEAAALNQAITQNATATAKTLNSTSKKLKLATQSGPGGG